MHRASNWSAAPWGNANGFARNWFLIIVGAYAQPVLSVGAALGHGVQQNW